MVKSQGRLFFIFMAIFCLFMLAVGCAEDKTENTDADKSAVPSGGEAPSAISLSILPERPRVDDGLQVIIKGMARSLTYEWKLNGYTVEDATTDSLGGGGLKKGDKVVVIVRADGGVASAKVVVVNTPPMIKSVTVLPRPIRSGTDVHASAEGEDIDRDFIRFDYQWIINGEESLLNADSLLNGEEFKRGDTLSVRVSVSDDEATGESYTTPGFVVVNASPQIISRPPTEFKGWEYSYQVRASDTDGDKIDFKLIEAPDGMKIDSSAMIKWEIKEASAGNHSVEIEADDNHGGVVTQRYELSIGISGE